MIYRIMKAVAIAAAIGVVAEGLLKLKQLKTNKNGNGRKTSH